MTGTVVIDMAQWQEFARLIGWIAFFAGLAGACAFDLLRFVWGRLQRMLDRRRGYDDFADAVEAVVSKMDRARG